MRIIGYSTGSLCRSDFRWALQILEQIEINAVELSALRFNELCPLVEALPQLPLGRFSYISFHVPSRFTKAQEEEVLSLMAQVPASWPLITHPDAIFDFERWRRLGDRVCIENMDKRKPVGQTAEQLRSVFKRLPDATLCFDIAHAKQIDPTMCEAVAILEENRARLCQIHMSEVDTNSIHQPINRWAQFSYSRVARWMPEDVPIILESPTIDDDVPAMANAVTREVGMVERIFLPSAQDEYASAV